MTTKRKSKKSEAVIFLEELSGGPLSLGALLMAIRQGDEVSQSELAHLLGISKSHLCDIEKGRKAVGPAKAQEYARVLGYPEVQFLELALQDQLRKLNAPFAVHLESLKTASV